jgi:uncharacterized protein (DUF433 family)
MKATDTHYIFNHRCAQREHHGDRRFDDFGVHRLSQRRSSRSERDEGISLWDALREALKWCPAISVNANIMEGRPCLAGTRIPVRAILRVIEQYGSVDGALRCYPHLTAEQINDALYFSQVFLELPSGIDEAAPVA